LRRKRRILRLPELAPEDASTGFVKGDVTAVPIGDVGCFSDGGESADTAEDLESPGAELNALDARLTVSGATSCGVLSLSERSLGSFGLALRAIRLKRNKVTKRKMAV
jgi:hypothetical protein